MKIKIFLTLLLLLVATLTLFNLLSGSKNKAETVFIKIICTNNIEDHIQLYGKINSTRNLQLMAPVDGVIEDVLNSGELIIKENATICRIRKIGIQEGMLEKQLEIAIIDLNSIKERKKDAIELYESKAGAKYQIKEYEIQELKQNIEINSLKKAIEPSIIKAPFRGLVTGRILKNGSSVKAGDKLCKIIDLQNLNVEFQVNEYYLSRVKKGCLVYYTNERTNMKYYGKIEEISRIDDNNYTYEIKASLEGFEEKDIYIGQSILADVIIGNKQKVITVPRQAIIYEEHEKFVLVYKNNILEKRIIKTGITNEKEAEVLSGLAKGDSVLVSVIAEMDIGQSLNGRIIKELLE